jgi:hypothetical protein
MCFLHLKGACGINWGIEKCQICRISARILYGKSKGKYKPRTVHEGPKVK